MKKQFILGFLCCLFLTFSINTLANYLYSAKDIEYKNENVNATNVQEALNELYEIENELNSLKKEGNASPDKILKGSSAVVQGELINGTYEETKVYYLGTGTNFNIKNLLPEIDYTTLTNENFIVSLNANVGVGISRSKGGWAANRQIDGLNGTVYKEEINYNNDTGILNITTKTYYYVYSAYGAYVTDGYGSNWVPKVYIVVGNINNLS